MQKFKLKAWDKSLVVGQWLLGWIFFVPFCGTLLFTLRYILGVHVEDAARHRAFYRQLTDSKTPLMICCNHLTYVDSVILIQLFMNTLRYPLSFRRLTWNLPASNYKSNPFFLLVGILSKCIFINRAGTRDEKERVLAKAHWVLSHGEPLTIFPEGRRSKTGRFDDSKLAYGIGKILSGMPECRVLCIYMRADGQTTQSKFPVRNAHYKMTYEVLNFSKERLAGSEAMASTTREIASVIKNLEARYFGEELAPLPGTQASDVNPQDALSSP